MTNGNGHDDDNVTPFRGREERRVLLELRAANDEPRREPAINLPPGVKLLTFLLVIISGVCLLLPEDIFVEAVYSGGFVPARYTGGLPFGLAAVLSPVTYQFLHSGILHTAVNVVTLMAFGTGLERAMGFRKMLLLYLLSGIAGALLHLAVYPDLQGPLIGASGAISGLFGAVLLLLRDSGAMGQGLQRMGFFIGIYLFITIFFGFFGVPGSGMAIGWTAHLGGFFAGLLLYKPLMRR